MFDFNKKKKRKQKASLWAMLGIGVASLTTAFLLSERYKPKAPAGKITGHFGQNPWSFRKMSVVIGVVVVLMLLVQISGLDKYFKTSLFDPLEQRTILDMGEKEIGKPYCIGGTGPDCFDCSGYVQTIMKRAVGVTLPRTSRDQSTIGNPISLEDAGIGDLVFFYTNPSAPTTVSHVGILATSDGKFLNANSWLGKIMYDDLNVEYWRTRLAGVREIQVAGREKVPVKLVPEEKLDTTPPAWEETLPPSEEADTRLSDISQEQNVVAAEVEISTEEVQETTMEQIKVSDFPDVSPGHTRYNEIIYLKQNGIVNGYEDGTFRPGSKITRAELLKIVMGVKGFSPSGESELSDVKGHWIEPYVATAKKLNIVGGYPDGTFKPNNDVSLVEALKIILNTLNVNVPKDVSEIHFSNVAPTEWYAPYLYVVHRDQLLDLFGDTVNPDSKILRQDVATMIYRIGQN